jgi:hypothetical protein
MCFKSLPATKHQTPILTRKFTSAIAQFIHRVYFPRCGHFDHVKGGTMRKHVFLSIAVAGLAACGGGGEDSSKAGTAFGMSSAEVLQQMLSDGDESNDRLARMFIEAGGIGAYLDMDDAAKAKLHAKHGSDPAAELEARNANSASVVSVLLAGGVGGSPSPADAMAKRLQTGSDPRLAADSDSSIDVPATAAPDFIDSSITACVPFLAVQHRNMAHAVGPNGTSFWVDSQGRASWAKAVFNGGNVPTAPRDGCSTTVGAWGASPPGTPLPDGGYVGGHLIAASLGGPPNRINLTPQAYRINISTFQRIESAVRYCAANARWRTDYAVTPEYSSSEPLTPGAYVVFIKITKPVWSWWSGYGGGEGAIRIPNWSGPGALGNLDLINSAVDAYTAQVRAVCP